MNKNRPAADRVRPILEAMERSIETARQRRLDTSGASAPAPAAPAQSRPTLPMAGDGRFRLKARPKRPGVLLPDVDRPLQSRAG
jgi:hypothetical protein